MLGASQTSRVVLSSEVLRGKLAAHPGQEDLGTLANAKFPSPSHAGWGRATMAFYVRLAVEDGHLHLLATVRTSRVQRLPSAPVPPWRPDHDALAV